MNVYVGRWDCEYCGSMGNLGPHAHCSQCGSSRPDDVVFYMPRGVEDKVTAEEELKIAKEGANWVCSFCSNNNRQPFNACTSCGALKADSEKYLVVQDFTESVVPRSSKPQRELTQTKPKKTNNSFIKILGFAALLIIGFFALSQFSTTINVDVTQIEWQRNIIIEEYKLVSESDWEVPKGGQTIKSYKDIHHYDQRIVGYNTRSRTVQEAVGSEQYVCGKRDLGNGYFEDKYCTRTIYRDRQEQYEEPVYQEFPVYKTKYDYEIYRWKPYKELKANGNDKLPEWSEISVTVKENKDKFRISKEIEHYYFEITDHKDAIHRYESNFDFWDNSIFKGKTLEAEKSTIFGYFKGLTNLEPKLIR